jgi:hypothetical protein
MRRALVVIALLGCRKSDYAHVYLEGADPELTVSPVDMNVDVTGAGALRSFEYTGKVVARSAGATPSTDFVLTFDDSPSGAVDVRAWTQTATILWGADTRIDVPAQGRELHLPLNAGETRFSRARLTDGAKNAALFGASGLAMAWLAETGVTYRVELNPDRLLALDTILEPDPNASRVRVVSRPATGFGSDLFVVTWKGGDGHFRVHTRTRTDESPTVDLGPFDDLVAACSKAGARADIVVVGARGGSLFARALGADGQPSADESAVNGISGVSAIVARTVLPGDRVAVALRTTAGAAVARASAFESVALSAPIDGDVRALAASGDGTRLLVASASAQGEMRLAALFLDSLQPAAPTHVVGTRTPNDDPRVTVASLDSCVLVWPEVRDGPLAAIDLRFVPLDLEGAPIGPAHYANVGETDDHFYPSAVCASPTRYFVTMIAGVRDRGFGDLLLRRLPEPPQ